MKEKHTWFIGGRLFTGEWIGPDEVAADSVEGVAVGAAQFAYMKGARAEDVAVLRNARLVDSGVTASFEYLFVLKAEVQAVAFGDIAARVIAPPLRNPKSEPGGV